MVCLSTGVGLSTHFNHVVVALFSGEIPFVGVLVETTPVAEVIVDVAFLKFVCSTIPAKLRVGAFLSAIHSPYIENFQAFGTNVCKQCLNIARKS